MSDDRTDIRNLSQDEIKALVAELGEKPYRAKQLWEWLWQKMASIKQQAGGNPEWLSTHPSDQSRINFFRNNVQPIKDEYAKYASIALKDIK